MVDQVNVSIDPKEARQKKAARTKQINRSTDVLLEAARVVAEKAGRIELHAAKNLKAGFDKGAENKIRQATDLRRLAAFLVDKRLHDLIRQDEQLVGMLLGELPIEARPGWHNHLTPRKIDMEAVKPSRKWPTRRFDDCYEFDGDA